MSTLSTATPRRILVVEDDHAIRDSLVTLLSEQGYSVEAIASGDSAFERLREGPPVELVLLDLMLPGLDGWEFRSRQRADPAIASIPVVAMSADDSGKATAIDADHFLRKPFSLEDLLQSVAQVLASHEQERERERLVEAERLAALGLLAAGAAHEISNPLSFASVNVDMLVAAGSRLDRALARGALDEAKLIAAEIGELASDARVGVERVTRVVRMLQSLGRREEGALRAVDLKPILETSIAMTWNEIRHRARLVRAFEEVPPVMGCDFRLGQLFTNLLVNAAQAVDGSGAEANEIGVALKAVGTDVVVEVRDTGRGIPPEARAHLFEPFFTTKPAGQGTGLGLSICHGIAIEHRGTIAVESEPGRGTTFRVSLPQASEAPTRAAAAPARADSPAPQGTRVLVVDDELHLAWSMKRLLEFEHQVVVAVTHGREVIDRLAVGERYDAIVCDLEMPYFGGEAVFQELEARFPDLTDKVVFLSGGARALDEDPFLSRAGRPVLKKPFDPEVLRSVVRGVARGPGAPGET